MRHPRAPLALAAGLFTLTAPIPAQLRAWVVDDDFPQPPGVDFSSIQDAVDAASEFDLILVRDGQYEAFSIFGKSLTVQGSDVDPAAVLVIPPTLDLETSLTIRQLSAQQSVSVRGMTFSNGVAFLGVGPAVDVGANQGAVALEDCVVQGNQGTAFLVSQSASVVLHRTSVASKGTRFDDFLGVYLAGAGLDVQSSSVDLIDCIVQGGTGADAFSGPLGISWINGFGDPGVRCLGTSSALTVVGSELRGGDGGSNVVGLCLAGEAGGDGLTTGGTSSVRLLDSALVPGQGGLGVVACSPGDGDAGLPLAPVGFPVQSVPGSARSFELAALGTGGGVVSAAWTGEPGDLVFLLFSNLPQNATWFDAPGVGLYLPLNSILVPVGTLDGSGAGSFGVPVGPFGPVNEYAPVFAQAVFLPQAGGLSSSGPSRSTWLSQLVFGP